MRAASIAVTVAAIMTMASMGTAQAPTFPYNCNAYLDVDQNLSTGGDVQVIQAGDPGPQTISGIDVIVSAIADLPMDPTDWGTVPGAVSNVEVLRWNDGLGDFEQISSTPVNYPTGPGNGLDGHHVIEFIAPLADIGELPGPIGMGYHVSGAAINDYTSPFVYRPQGITGIPAVSVFGALVLGCLLAGGGLLMLRRHRAAGIGVATVGLLVVVAGVAWAATITPDGNVGDWTGISPSVSDPIGDSSGGDANEDIVYGFVTDDETTMGFRIDVLNVAVTDPYPTPQPTPQPTPPPA